MVALYHVLYSLQNPVDRQRLVAAARAVEVEPVEWRIGESRRAVERVAGSAVAMVWDLDDGDGSSLRLVRDLRAVRPALPVLVLLPVRPGTMHLAGRAGAIPGVVVRGNWQRAEDGQFLARFVRRARDAAPAGRTLEALCDTPRPLPAIVRRFIRAVLERLLREAPTNVGVVAGDLELTDRQLRLRWPGDPCPPPLETVGWSEIMLFATMGDADSRTPNAVAREFGHDARSFRRLRLRLAIPPTGVGSAGEAFEIIQSAYRARWRRRVRDQEEGLAV